MQATEVENHTNSQVQLLRARGEGARRATGPGGEGGAEERPAEPGHLPRPNAPLPSFLPPSVPGAALRSLPREPQPPGVSRQGRRRPWKEGSSSPREAPCPSPGEARPLGAGGASRGSLPPPLSPPPPPSAGGPEGKPCPSSSSSSQVAAAISVRPSSLPPAAPLHLWRGRGAGRIRVPPALPLPSARPASRDTAAASSRSGCGPDVASFQHGEGRLLLRPPPPVLMEAGADRGRLGD